MYYVREANLVVQPTDNQHNGRVFIQSIDTYDTDFTLTHTDIHTQQYQRAAEKILRRPIIFIFTKNIVNRIYSSLR